MELEAPVESPSISAATLDQPEEPMHTTRGMEEQPAAQQPHRTSMRWFRSFQAAVHCYQASMRHMPTPSCYRCSRWGQGKLHGMNFWPLACSVGGAKQKDENVTQHTEMEIFFFFKNPSSLKHTIQKTSYHSPLLNTPIAPLHKHM